MILELSSKLAAERQGSVLRFDNYGRGWSSSDGTPQNATLFVNQLAELLWILVRFQFLASRIQFLDFNYNFF